MSEYKLVELFLGLTLEINMSPVERQAGISPYGGKAFFHSWHLEEEEISHRAVGGCPLTHASHNRGQR